MAKQKPAGVIAAVQRDHREIERMLDEVEGATGTARREAFGRLAAKLQAHEQAEEEVVHPLAEREGNDETVTELEDEESAASRVLSRLIAVDVDSDEFARMFSDFKRDVLAHAQQEEQEEHPELMRNTPAEELERRGEMFEEVEANASES